VIGTHVDTVVVNGALTGIDAKCAVVTRRISWSEKSAEIFFTLSYKPLKAPAEKTGIKEFVKGAFQECRRARHRARASTTFVERRVGDVFISWENEVFLAINELGKEKFDLIFGVAAACAIAKFQFPGKSFLVT
jgi:ABC-type sulfate transport system substrate-binding protein